MNIIMKEIELLKELEERFYIFESVKNVEQSMRAKVVEKFD